MPRGYEITFIINFIFAFCYVADSLEFFFCLFFVLHTVFSNTNDFKHIYLAL